MNARTMVSLSTTAALALVAFAGVGTAQAKTTTAIDKGGAFCFQFGSTAPGATRTVLALDIDAADHLAKPRLWWASGLEKATNVDVRTENYVNNLSGTATLARPNNGASGGKLLHMSLTGTSTGTSPSGLWQLDYNLQLDPKTLKGRILGVSTFTPIGSDGESQTVKTDAKIKPLNCKKV